MNRTLPRTAHALRRLPVLLLAAAALFLAAAVPARAAVTSELCPSCGAGWVLTYEHCVSRETLAAAPLRPRRGRAGRHRAHQVAACARLYQLRLAGFWRTLRHHGRSLPAGHSARRS